MKQKDDIHPLTFGLLDAPVALLCPFRSGHTVPSLVYNYTLSGVRRDERGWEPCVDTGAQGIMGQSWSSATQLAEESEFGSCCYGFALTFINHMRSLDGKVSLSRDQFTGSHLLPRMKTVSLYVNIHHAILQHGFYIADAPHDM
ncbi:MKRN2 opposite strand protein-like [Sinocyclocheilus grahami]|uniref:MKRN2 opposite strand protein-like n=1 Tax=Sinocyclocheilus grahami TaxID=75366 RepID=UPI0007ACAAAD|nr:PREDICTED: MKRN2 opposite strand protein-like [Sinocyclocheilus grahami]